MTLGVVFPGQGSQRVGMLEEAAGAFSVVRETFSEASDALGYDMWALVSQDPDARLSLTEFTQPAILTASVALFRAFESCPSIAPVAAAGHSLGAALTSLIRMGFLGLRPYDSRMVLYAFWLHVSVNS